MVILVALEVQRTAVVAGDIGAAGIAGCAGSIICSKAFSVAEAGNSAVSVVQLDVIRIVACRQRRGREQREQHHKAE